MSIIQQVDQYINFLKVDIKTLEDRKEVLQRMQEYLKALNKDEKQALYDLLSEQKTAGHLGWSQRLNTK